MSIPFTFSSALLSAALLATALPAAAESFVTFQVPGATSFSVAKINNSGVVAGSYTSSGGQSRGFVRSASGEITSFDVNGLSTTAMSLSDDGTVAGYYTDGGGLKAFTRSPAGVITPLVTPGSFSVAYAINNLGSTSGFYRNEQDDDFANRGFVATANGGFTSISMPAGMSGSVASALNDGGDSAGNFEVLYLNTLLKYVGFVQTASGVLTSFEAGTVSDPAGIPQTEVAGLNNAGTAAGVFRTVVCPFNCATKSSQGYVRSAGGQITLFKVGATRSLMNVAGINNAGQIVGDYTASRGASGFVRAADGAVTTFKVPKMLYTSPSSINDQGVVAGTCLKSGSSTYLGFLRLP